MEVSNIERVYLEEANQTFRSSWTPVVGHETTQLFTHLKATNRISADAQAQIEQQTVEILGKCVAPIANGQENVGLVIGYVQSGKTMSFTALIALARDNGFRIVIVLTGVSVLLFNQSKDRLEDDLRCNDAENPNRRFAFIENPKANENVQRIVQLLSQSTAENLQRTIVLPVMKNVDHLRALTSTLRAIESNLRGVAVLVIDDEADQASLNLKVNQGSQSPTYQHILAIKNAIPHHSYLQYTATPQAPLLINMIDVLSPDFVQVLSTGTGYTGGQVFFRERRELVRDIPLEDLAVDISTLEPPRSLVDALRIFFLGVAASFHSGQTQKNRTMMVHPDRHKAVHTMYKGWVEDIVRRWNRLAHLDPSDVGRNEFFEEFRDQYSDLAATVTSDLPTFEELVAKLPQAITETNIVELNTKNRNKMPEVKWVEAYPWILVGGTALDRGFTVEGLTVTYMPREGGVGNADTIQQRSRFCGYKGAYLGYCRIFLAPSLRAQYEHYVVHEENVREQLVYHIRSKHPLSSWKRRFLLDSSLQPTRRSVLDLDYYRGKNHANHWCAPKSPHVPAEAIAANRDIVTRFLERFTFDPVKAHPRNNDNQIQLVAHVDLTLAYKDLLVPLTFGLIEDTVSFTGLMLQIEELIRREEGLEPSARTRCVLFQMSRGQVRKRTLSKTKGWVELFQGRDAPTKYPGDKAVLDSGAVSIQIYRLNLIEDDQQGTIATPERYDETYAVAVRLPRGSNTYIQDDPGLHG